MILLEYMLIHYLIMKFCLSDDGLTINELEMLGIDINTKTRTKSYRIF